MFDFQSSLVCVIASLYFVPRYQVRFKVLQAGQYGAPQGRKRVLFWGAKRGLPLPEFPMPTHGFSQKSWYHNLPTGEKLPPPSRSKDSDNLHHYAPLHSVTINDAIGDLVSNSPNLMTLISSQCFSLACVRLVGQFYYTSIYIPLKNYTQG